MRARHRQVAGSCVAVVGPTPSTGTVAIMIATARPLPSSAQLSVAGVSFRAAAVSAAYPGERLTICHVDDNPHDGFACEVRGEDHRLLGYIPAALSGRVVATMHAAGTHPNLGATVDEVVGSETLGLRIHLTTSDS